MINPLRVGLRWLRGVRARLIVTFAVAAAVAGILGVLIFDVVLSHALLSDVDSDLRITAAQYAANVDYDADTPPRTVSASSRHTTPVSTVAAVFAPNGTLLAAEPRILPAGLYPGKAAAAHSGFDTTKYSGATVRRHWLRVTTPRGRGLVVVGQSLRSLDAAHDDAQQLLFVIVPIAIVLSAIGAWLLSGAAVRPVEQMRSDAQRLGESGKRGRIGRPATSDNLARLADTFNELLDTRQTALDRQRALVADAGHELRSPLTVLQTELDTADRPGRTREDLAESIAHAREETARLARLADNLLLLAQSDGGVRLVRPELVDVADVLARAARTHRSQFDTAGITLECSPDRAAGLVAELDPSALQRILDNLLLNAVYQTQPGGSVWLRAEPGNETGGSRTVVVSVADDGPGFPPEFLPQAFGRFTRADRSRRRSDTGTGTGLGLSIVEALVTAHGGQVTAANRREGGAVITVVLPAEQGLESA